MIHLSKYLDATDETHSLLRLLSARIISSAIILTLGLFILNAKSIKIDSNLIDLNLWMYIIGITGKGAQKFIEKYKG